MSSTGALVARVALGFAVSYLLGFERELRGSPAGDRTFALVGTAATAITAVTFKASPQAIAGIVTGVGFIGGGLVLHRDGGNVVGLTSAATIFATAGIGIVVGSGHLLLGAVVAFAVLLTLELRNIPVLSRLDARRYRGRVRADAAEPRES